MEIACILFLTVVGTLGHFIFEWSGHRKWAGLFFAVNESTWEHIKLTIYPSALMALYFGLRYGFTPSLAMATAGLQVTEILLIPGLFYGYTAFTHKNWLITDIICFILTIIAGTKVFFALLGQPCCTALLVLSLAVIIAVQVAYFSFSYHPPHCFLFRDPISGGFGPKGHGCHSHFHNI